MEIPKVNKLGIWKLFDREIESRVPRYKKRIIILFKKQEQKILALFDVQKKSNDNYFSLDIEEEQNEFQKELKNVSVGIVLEHQQLVNELFLFNAYLTDKEILNFVEKNINKFAKETTKETNERLAKTINEGLADGDSVPQLKKRVEAVFTTATKSRAEMIARTEMTRTATWTNESIYRKAGVSAKEWYVNPGACEFCIPMNGRIVNIDSSFLRRNTVVIGENGGSLPLKYETVSRPPLHPNCRCDLLPILI